MGRDFSGKLNRPAVICVHTASHFCHFRMMIHQINVPCLGNLCSTTDSKSLTISSSTLSPITSNEYVQPVRVTLLFWHNELGGCDLQVLRLTLAGWHFHLEMPWLHTRPTWKNKYWSAFWGCAPCEMLMLLTALDVKVAIITTIIIRYKFAEGFSSSPFILMMSVPVGSSMHSPYCSWEWLLGLWRQRPWFSRAPMGRPGQSDSRQ